MLTDFDVIGFNTEHTLVKFNNIELTKLLISGHLKALHEQYEYPEVILDFDYDKNINLCLNNAVWDIENGLILKLSGEKEIFYAMRGYERVSDAELFEIYGEPPTFNALKWPETNKVIDQD